MSIGVLQGHERMVLLGGRLVREGCYSSRRSAPPMVPEGRLRLAQLISRVFSFLLGGSILPFLCAVWKSFRTPKIEVDDPWGYSGSLEWATSCPPPRHNFTSIPRIGSERSAFDLHHPGVDPPKFSEPDRDTTEQLLRGPNADPAAKTGTEPGGRPQS